MDIVDDNNKSKKEKRKIDNSKHSELCDRAEKWLKKSHSGLPIYLSSCSVVLKEMVSLAIEQPDCIGFNSSYSILIECKTSISDFKKDKQKPFRKNPNLGMGNFRFFLTEKGLIKIEELPENWGLLELYGKKIIMKKCSERFENTAQAEYPLLFSALRRKVVCDKN